jgi:hypothetical protein
MNCENRFITNWVPDLSSQSSLVQVDLHCLFESMESLYENHKVCSAYYWRFLILNLETSNLGSVKNYNPQQLALLELPCK